MLSAVIAFTSVFIVVVSARYLHTSESRWPREYTESRIAFHDNPTPILRDRIDQFRRRLKNWPNQELVFCVTGVNWSFDIDASRELPVVDAVDLVAAVLREWTRYIPYFRLRARENYQNECFATVEFKDVEVSRESWAYATNTHIVMKNLHRFDDPIIWYVTLAHEIGHVFCLADDYDGPRSVMNSVSSDRDRAIFPRDVYAIQGVLNEVYGEMPPVEVDDVAMDFGEIYKSIVAFVREYPGSILLYALLCTLVIIVYTAVRCCCSCCKCTRRRDGGGFVHHKQQRRLIAAQPPSYNSLRFR